MDTRRNHYAEYYVQVSSRSKRAQLSLSTRNLLNFEFASAFQFSVRYYLQFEARMGMRIFSDVAIDDFSLSPECFGLNIPQEHLQGYNYWDPRIFKHKIPHSDFVNKTGGNGVRA